MATAQTELLIAAQDGQRMLHAIVSRRLKFEKKQISRGLPIQDFIRRETQDLARVHDAFDDGLFSYQKLLTERPFLIEEDIFYNTLNLMGRHGMLPPGTGPMAEFISRVQGPPDLEKARQLQKQCFKSREEDNGQV